MNAPQGAVVEVAAKERSLGRPALQRGFIGKKFLGKHIDNLLY
jgi:hypothetical protein